MATPNEIYELKATLRHIKPPIWRRLQIRADATLEELHYALQDAFGWTNSHLHRFLVGKRSYGMILDELDEDLEDDRGVRLREVTRVKSKLVYQYDFGDDWEHDLVIEKVLPTERARATRAASTAPAPARPRTAAGPTATRSWSTSSPIRNTSATKSCSTGSSRTSPPTTSISARSTARSPPIAPAS